MSKKLLFALALVGFSLTACTPDALPDSPEIPEQMMEDDDTMMKDDTDTMMNGDVMLDVDSEELGGDPNEKDEDDAMMEDDGTTEGY